MRGRGEEEVKRGGAEERVDEGGGMRGRSGRSEGRRE